MDATGWAVVITAACVGVGGIITGVVNIVIGYLDRRDRSKAERERIEREDAREERLRTETLWAADKVASKVEVVAAKVEIEAAKVAQKVEAVKVEVKTEAKKVAETLLNANGTLKVEIVQAVSDVVQNSPAARKDR